MTIRHKTQITGSNNPNKQVSKNAWNDDHYETGLISGCLLTRVSNTTLGVAAGSLDINGTIYVNAGSLTITPSIAADTLYMIYAVPSGSGFVLEASTTVPVWDAALNYWKKTGDATRRFIGCWRTFNNLGIKFVRGHAMPSKDRTRCVVYDSHSDGLAGDGGFYLVQGGAPGGSGFEAWTSFDASGIAPPSVRRFICAMLIGAGVDQYYYAGLNGADMTFGLPGDNGELAFFDVLLGATYGQQRLVTGFVTANSAAPQTIWQKFSSDDGVDGAIWTAIKGVEYEV